MTRAILIIVFSLSFFDANSQSSLRPKVGLVLSGGGARGLAHIGVLRAMEKAGLRPDYITGTSMGSIVGGLYAIGYSAQEIEDLTSEVNWDALLSNEMPLNQITFEEKEYYGRYIAELPVNGIKVGLPKGLIEGQKLSEMLSRLTRDAHDIEDFRELPIPFTCVASDIATGEPVILNQGSLAESIRASMAIPTVFTPVEIDDRLLVDGGLVRNFPVEEVLDMGAEIVIGVFVSSDLNSKEKLDNLISVLTQSAFVTSAFDSRKQRKQVDIYIEPDLDEFTPGSFNMWQEIIEKGKIAGDSIFGTFRDLADSLNQLGPQGDMKILPTKDEYLVTDIVIEGNKKISSKLIKGKMRITEGSIISIDEIEKNIALIYGTRYFDKVNYQINRDGAKFELKIKVVEVPDGHLKLAAHYDSENDVGINANLTYRNLLLSHSRAVLEFDLSKNPRLDINLLKYLGDKQNVGIQLGYKFQSDELPFYDENIESSRFDADNSNLYLRMQSTAFQNFTFGGLFQVEYSELTPVVGEIGKVIKQIKNRNITGVFYVKYNSFDRQFFPSSGTQFEARLKRSFDVYNRATQVLEDSTSSVSTTIAQHLDPYIALELYFTHIFKVSDRFSIITKNAVIGSSLSEPDFNITDYYFIGGFNPRFRNVTEYWGEKDKKYVAPNYFYTKLTLQWEVINNLYLSGIANYIDVENPMAWFYDANVDNYLGGQKRRLGYGFSAGYYSFLGPISISYARDIDTRENLFNLNIGFWFN